jgi:hypothetical protein
VEGRLPAVIKDADYTASVAMPHKLLLSFAGHVSSLECIAGMGSSSCYWKACI